MYFVCILGEDVMFFREVAKITTTYYLLGDTGDAEEVGFFRSLDRGVVLPKVC